MTNHFNISAFTHKGTIRETNQDHILVNGQIFNEGTLHLTNQEDCICFVADGVGGNKAGDFASYFVLEKINSILDFSKLNIEEILRTINKQLISESNSKEELTGTATTLTGLIVTGEIFRIIHAGDSQVWLLRNNMFFKVTNDQVIDETEINSPITSYFGGKIENLKFDTNITVQELWSNDIILICSDGLFKSLNHKTVKSILMADKDLGTKVNKILENCLQTGAEDNISVILIQPFS